jgi:hypothetical protein
MAKKKLKRTTKKVAEKPIPTWKSADGTVRKITEMSDDHIANTINYLRLKARKINDNYELFARLDLTDGCHQFVAPEPLTPSQLWPVHYPAFIEEAIKRRLMRDSRSYT